jgi:V8-like Glu-specific endopeptidase
MNVWRAFDGRGPALVLAVVALGAAGTGCWGADDSFGALTVPIVDGEPTDGFPAVVYVLAGSAAGGTASCTGSLVAPQAVLTAKHCIDDGSGAPRPPEEVRVFTGNDATSPTGQYNVMEVREAPGGWSVTSGDDVAMLLLAEPILEDPLEMSFADSVVLVDRLVAVVGYGMTPEGTHGTKLVADKRIERVDSRFLWIEPAICQGDSGGPAIGSEGAVWGVASFIHGPAGTEPECGTASGAFVSIQRFSDFILDAVVDSGHCIPVSEEETCNGRDDNCDGTVDEGCLPLGDPCTSSDECTGGMCGETVAGQVCTQPCNPLEPHLGCPSGMHCGLGDVCEGWCTPGTASTDAPGLGGACEGATDCHSLYCGDGGGGGSECMQPCRADAGLCLAGEACSVAEGCGGCAVAGAFAHPRGLGEPCGDDADCALGRCLDEGGIRYCSRTCASDGDCVEGFHCRLAPGSDDVCIRGLRQPPGGPCVASGDCAEGLLCAWRGARRWCAPPCAPGGCPDGFTCDEDAAICAPIRALLGEACTADGDCLSAQCDVVGRRQICTQPCRPEAQCGPGLECVRVDDRGAALCAPPDLGGGGGCAAAGGGRPFGDGVPAWWLPVVVALAWRRGRRGLVALGAFALALTTSVGCTDLQEFETGPEEVYRGMVRGTEEASFIRRGFPERTIMELTFDPALADSNPGSLSTDDTACGEATFADTPLRSAPPLAHDQLSLYDFPGAARVRNFIYLAVPETGALAGHEVPVFVSLVRGGQVEVRVVSGFGAGACEPADACTCFFGVFELTKESNTP